MLSPLVIGLAAMTQSIRVTIDDVIAVPSAGAAEFRHTGVGHAGVVPGSPQPKSKMGRALLAGVVALVLLAAPGRVRAAGPTANELLSLLYPQSVAWRVLDTFPHPSPHLLDDPIHVETLGYFDRLQTDADRCSPMLRLFLGPDPMRRFRSADVFGPGDDDLVYAGQKPCAEGEWTIIWRHGLNRAGRVSVFVLDSEVRRVLAGPQPKAIGVAGGCCGDPWNYDCLYDPIPHESCTAVPDALTIPRGARPARSDLTLRHEVKLLRAPNETIEQGDPYEPPLRTAGTAAEQFMIVADGAGRPWHLVRVAAKQGEVSGHASFVLGWVAE